MTWQSVAGRYERATADAVWRVHAVPLSSQWSASRRQVDSTTWFIVDGPPRATAASHSAYWHGSPKFVARPLRAKSAAAMMKRIDELIERGGKW